MVAGPSSFLSGRWLGGVLAGGWWQGLVAGAGGRVSRSREARAGVERVGRVTGRRRTACGATMPVVTDEVDEVDAETHEDDSGADGEEKK